MTSDRKTCFVIMPFSKTSDQHTEEYWTNFFEKILKPYIEEAGSLEVHRSTALRVDIIRQIISDLVTSDVVVADLTDRNPNVYWELGIRQSFRHGTVTIIEGVEELPFDVRTKGTLSYLYRDALKMEIFKTELQQAVKDCLVNPNRPDSQVLETISGRGTLFEMFRRDETIRRLNALLSEVSFNKRLIQFDEQSSGHPSQRLRIVAIELLVVNKYLDDDDTFYSEASDYLFLMESLNEQWRRYNEVPAAYIPPMPGLDPLDEVRRFECEMVRIRKKLINQV